jgi:Cu(I)/Ag(I) efflux system membrane protein CusA/SilA
VGGVIVMRSGRNALSTIAAVKAKLAELKGGLPPGVEIVPTYDRSQLIGRAVSNLERKLVEEFIVVALVCFAFLLHLRSALVAVVALPLGVLAAFGVMHLQGINANIMSLGGIAIAIGAMVDAAIVMIENVHRRLAAAQGQAAGGEVTDHWNIVGDACAEVGPRFSSACSSSRFRSSRSSRWRRRRAGSSRRWRSPRRMRWPLRRAFR